jgi:lysine biosynthesis protein LysW
MSRKLTEITGANCPDCYAEVLFRRQPELGQKIACHVCNTELEVIRMNPLRLGWILEDELDYEALDDESMAV